MRCCCPCSCWQDWRPLSLPSSCSCNPCTHKVHCKKQSTCLRVLEHVCVLAHSLTSRARFIDYVQHSLSKDGGEDSGKLVIAYGLTRGRSITHLTYNAVSSLPFDIQHQVMSRDVCPTPSRIVPELANISLLMVSSQCNKPRTLGLASWWWPGSILVVKRGGDTLVGALPLEHCHHNCDVII